MATEFVPIDPTLMESGALAALVPEFGEEEAKPVPITDRADALNNFQVISDALSLSVAAQLSVGAIFSGSAASNERGFYFDAMTFTDRYRESTDPSAGVSATRWGIGMRVLLRVEDLSAKASLNFAMVGAAVELGQARARYEIRGFGLGVAGLVTVLQNIEAIGEFSYDTYLKLNRDISPALATYIDENAGTMKPQPVAVAVTRSLDRTAQARSIYHAIRCIADRKPLRDALEEAGVRLDRPSIRRTYFEFLGSDDATLRPTRDQDRAAEDWLRTRD